MEKGIIEVEEMEFYAYHGCYKLEQSVGNRFFVNVRMEGDLSVPAETDDVTTTVNYLEVYRVTAEQMAITSHILEHVARRIIDALYRTFPQLSKVTVKVSKMYPPLGGKTRSASVTLTR